MSKFSYLLFATPLVKLKVGLQIGRKNERQDELSLPQKLMGFFFLVTSTLNGIVFCLGAFFLNLTLFMIKLSVLVLCFFNCKNNSTICL
jgi:hypothetical protein